MDRAQLVEKGLEVWFTLLIEMSWGKQRILEVYLNIAEWGPGVFGLEAASRYHFSKSAAQLTPMQSALLASTLPSPLKYDPARPQPHLVERAHWNLEQQERLGGAPGWYLYSKHFVFHSQDLIWISLIADRC